MSNLVIDLGTTNLKMVYFKGTNIIDEYNDSYDTFIFENEKVIDIAKLKETIDNFIKKIGGKFEEVYVYSFAEGGIFIDKNTLQNISPLFFWNNNIGEKVMKENEKSLKSFFQNNGLQMKPKYSIFRIAEFVNKNKIEKEKFIWLNAADYICFYLTNEIYTNESLAVRTGVYDIKNSCYSKEVLELFNLSETNFPSIKNKVIKDDITIVNCGHDHLNLLNILSDRPIISTGTTQVVLQPIEQKKISSLYSNGYHIIYHNNATYAMGSVENSGSRIDNFIELNFRNISYDEIINNCLEYPENNVNVMFMNLLDEIANEVSSKIIGSFDKIYVTGGLSKNKIYMQKLSNISKAIICVLDSTYTTMFGAQNIQKLNITNIYYPTN